MMRASTNTIPAKRSRPATFEFEALEAPLTLPQLQHAVLELGQIKGRSDRCEAHLVVRRRHTLSFGRLCGPRRTQKSRPAPGTALPWYHPSWRACACPLIALLTELLSGWV